MRASFAILALFTIVDQLAQVSAHLYPKAIADISNIYNHNSYIDRKVRRKADAIINHESFHHRRVAAAVAASAPAASSSAPSTSSSPNPATWNATTTASCMMAIQALNGTASNPSGMAACYNVYSLNNGTGAFQVDLRLYRVAAATGDWASVKSMSVELSYPNATIANSDPIKRDINMLISAPLIDLEGREIVSRAVNSSATSQMLSDSGFVGQINNATWSTIMTNQTAQKAVLTPKIILTGAGPSGPAVNTTVDSTEASFNNGLLISPTAAPFVLPGVTLGMFPVGLIITSAWTLIFVVALGYGTINRIRFRDHYRRRVKRGMTMDVRTI